MLTRLIWREKENDDDWYVNSSLIYSDLPLLNAQETKQ